MSNGSSQHSVRLSKPADPAIVLVLRAVDRVAAAVKCPFFMVGAAARDLVLLNLYNLRSGRATQDIDFGVAVENWERFRTLTEALIATGDFSARQTVPQRLIYKDRLSGLPVPIDLIPYGGVASLGTRVAWPPEGDTVFNVSGFEEAQASSLLVEIADGFLVRVASIPGLTLLKLIAWADRGGNNNKDAADLHRLLADYADAGNTDRLYEQEAALLEAAKFDLQLAGAELLGCDVAAICGRPTADQIREVLTSEQQLDLLVSQMVRSSSYEENAGAITAMVQAFSRGFLGES